VKFRLRQIFKDISLTFITQVIVLIAFFFVYRLIAKNFGPEGVGEYSLIKRISGFLLPILLLGVGIGLPRYIAMSRDEEQRSNYIKVGAGAIAAFTFIFLIFINLFKEYFANTFFGNTRYTVLVLPFSLFLLGSILHAFTYSYFRGRLFAKTFNFLQIMNLALVPIGIIFFFKGITIENLITLIGITTLIISFIFSIFFIREFLLSTKKLQLKKSFKELFQYSLPRVPAIFAWQGLLSVGPIFAAHFATIEEVGYLLVSQNLLKAIGTAMTPIGLILLPKVSNLIANGRQEIIKEHLNFLVGAVLQCSIFICFQVMIFTDVIVEYWLGYEFYSAIPVMRVMFLSVVFYAFYEAVRNILDAAEIKPLNTINLFISLGVFLTIEGILFFLVKVFSQIINLSIALTSAIICLGILTYISIRKIYPERLKNDLSYLGIAVLINVLLGNISMFAKSFVISKFYYLIIFEILMSIIYLLILWLFKMQWIRKIPKVISYN